MRSRILHYSTVSAGAAMGFMLGICGHFAWSDLRYWALFFCAGLWAALAYQDGLQAGIKIGSGEES